MTSARPASRVRPAKRWQVPLRRLSAVATKMNAEH
jgi:hypothetical protein